MCMCIVKRGRRLIQSYRNAAWRGLDSTALRVSLASTPIGGRKRSRTHTHAHIRYGQCDLRVQNLRSLGKSKLFLYLVSGAFHLEPRRINDEHRLKYIYLSIYRTCCIKQGQERRGRLERGGDGGRSEGLRAEGGETGME